MNALVGEGGYASFTSSVAIPLSPQYESEATQVAREAIERYDRKHPPVEFAEFKP